MIRLIVPSAEMEQRALDFKRQFFDAGERVISGSYKLDQDRYTMLQPDLLVVCDADRIRKRLIFGAPDLAIEILSPSSRSRDLVLKLRKYKTAGVREYWVIDPEYRQVFVYLFGEESILHMYSFHDKIPVSISGGECVIDFEEISSMLV